MMDTLRTISKQLMHCFRDFWTLLLRYVFFWGISSHCSLRKHPFLLALRRWGRFAGRNVPSYEERGETDVGYSHCYQTSRLEALQHLFILRNLSFNSTDHFLEFLICPVTVCSVGPVLFCCIESNRTAELLHLFQYKVIQDLQSYNPHDYRVVNICHFNL